MINQKSRIKTLFQETNTDNSNQSFQRILEEKGIILHKKLLHYYFIDESLEENKERKKSIEKKEENKSVGKLFKNSDNIWIGN